MTGRVLITTYPHLHYVYYTTIHSYTQATAAALLAILHPC